MLRESSPLWRQAMIEKGYSLPEQKAPSRFRLRHKVGGILLAASIVAAVILLRQ